MTNSILDVLLRQIAANGRAGVVTRIDIDDLDPDKQQSRRVRDDQADHEREQIRNGEGSL